ncbi:hypothetical protein JCM24511_02260 [Saitozyma sp. JCM 24511]|nr:hypothetical protein JCM24511_02260 [Saitozyma sp. JCM 24511]
MSLPRPALDHGPLGPLPGMQYDPVKKRYFFVRANAPAPSPVPSKQLLPPTGCVEEGRHKRRRAEGADAGPSDYRRRRGAAVRRPRQTDDRLMEDRIAQLRQKTTHHLGACHSESITSIKTFSGGAYYATTDHGKVIIHRADGEATQVSICRQGLIGLHCDIPRMIMMAVAGGSEAHVHHFRRDPELLEHVFMQHSEINLPHGDIFCMSSFDGICSLGGTRSLITIQTDSRIMSKHRRLVSDPLAIHQSGHDLVYAGLRGSTVSLEDLRIAPGMPNVVAAMPGGKAIVGVKRLKDSAVPWGLAASAMGDEMLIFDVRFGREPLHRLEGHVNNFHQNLGLATSPDDQFVFAAGSDKRIRCWSTLTGRRVSPPIDTLDNLNRGPVGPSLLSTTFAHRVSAMEVRDDWGVDVAVQGELQRFGPVF